MLSYSELSRPTLWKIPHVPNNMQTRPSLTIGAITLIAIICAAVVIPDSPAADRAPPAAMAGRRAENAPPLQPERAPAKSQSAGLFAQAEPSQPRSGDAAETDDAGGEKRRTAKGQLEWARLRLAENTSVQARLVETVSLLDHSFKAEGRYLQSSLQSNHWFVRLELTMKIGDRTGTLLEVCDGDILWTRHQVGAEPTITRRNVTQIVDAARKNGMSENALVADLGLGGLPALLASLEQNMEFRGQKQDTLRERHVIVIQGSWNNDLLTQWLGPQKEGETPPLPAFIPDLTRLALDAETGFPLQIQYLKRIPNRSVLRPMLTLDFLDVVLDQPIDKNEFVFVPPDRTQPVEVTPMYLNQIKQQGAQAPPPGAPAVPGAPAGPASPLSLPNLVNPSGQ